MRLHFLIFTGRYLQKTDFLGPEEKRQTLSNFRDLTFPISSFPIFQLSNFPTLKLSNLPTFQFSNFLGLTFQLSNFSRPNFPTFQHSKVRPRKIGKLESWKVGKLGPGNWKVGKLGPENWKIGKLENWKVSKPESWKVGKLESWRIGKLESWRIGKLENWKAGKLECWKVRSKKVGKLGRTKLESWKVKPKNIGQKLKSQHIRHNISTSTNTSTHGEYINYSGIMLFYILSRIRILISNQ